MPDNALKLENFADNSINKIATDPPWGLYKKTKLNLRNFYSQILDSFCRVLKTNGLIIILTAQKEIVETQLANFENQLKLEKTYHTLVSGKKAGVYKIRKTN